LSRIGVGAKRARGTIPDATTVETIDEAGYGKRRVHDVHGRLIRVEEGREGETWVETGAYRYDAAGRMVEMTDGGVRSTPSWPSSVR
jgi:YD repeat-containing protein